MMYLGPSQASWTDETGRVHSYRPLNGLGCPDCNGTCGGMRGLGAVGCGCVPTPGCIRGLGEGEPQGSGAVKVMLLLGGVLIAWALVPAVTK